MLFETDELCKTVLKVFFKDEVPYWWKRVSEKCHVLFKWTLAAIDCILNKLN